MGKPLGQQKNMDGKKETIMDKSQILLYLQVAGRYVKIAWTHKIQEEEGDINVQQNKWVKNSKCILSALTSAGVIGTLFSWSGETWISIITAIIAAASAFLVWRFPDGELITKSQANKAYAAKVRHLRNRYESLLYDIKACNLSVIDIIKRRNELEEEERILFSETVPHTSSCAVKNADKALNERLESTTTLKEINAIIPKELQLSQEQIESAMED